MKAIKICQDGNMYCRVGHTIVPPSGHMVVYYNPRIRIRDASFRRFVYKRIARNGGKKLEKTAPKSKRVNGRTRLGMKAFNLPIPQILDHKFKDEETIENTALYQRFQEELDE